MSIDQNAPPPASEDLDEDLFAPDPDQAEEEPASKRDWTNANEKVDRGIDWIWDNWPTILVGLGVFLYWWYFRHLTIQIHKGYGTSAFDIGVFDQGTWLLSRFHNPFVTITGRNLFADHTSFILILLVPFYWLGAGASFLLSVQALVLALGAVPVYLVGKKRIGAPLAAFLALAYLLHPALQAANMENYHPDSFLALFVALALYAAIEDRRILFVASIILCLMVKEDAILVVLPIALWYTWRRKWQLGAIVAAGSLVWTWLSFKIIRSFNHNIDLQGPLRIPFGGKISGLVKTTYRQPGQLYDYLRSDQRPWYIWQMVVPTAFGWIFAPEIMLIAVPVLLWNITSTFGYQHGIGYHYTFVVIPVLSMATVWGVSRLNTARHRQIAVAVITLSALWCAFLWGPTKYSRYKEPGHWLPSNPVVQQIEDIRHKLPDNAVVTAYHSFVPHLEHRQRVYMWPTPWSAAYWGQLQQEGEKLSFTNDIQYLFLPTQLSADDQKIFDTFKDQFVVVASNPGATLYKRVRPG